MSYLALFCSKEGAAQVRLKLVVVGDEQGHNFTFLAPGPAALEEREVFKRELSTIISRNRAGFETAQNHPSPFASTPNAYPRGPQPSPGSTPGPRTPVPAGSPLNPEEFHLRKNILLKHPELAALHSELVFGGQITEVEFWEGREVMTCLVFSCAPFADIEFSKSNLFLPKPPLNDKSEGSWAEWSILVPLIRTAKEKLR